MNVSPSKVTLGLGFLAAARHLEALERSNEGLRRADDIEDVHQARVSLRRLRSVLDLLAPQLGDGISPLERRARKILGVLGPVRDLDVQIDFLVRDMKGLKEPAFRPGIRRLWLRLKNRRAELQNSIAELCATSAIVDLCNRTRRAISSWDTRQNESWILYPFLLPYIEDLLAFDEFIHRQEAVEPLHKARIAAKRLRYALEIVLPLDPEALQRPVKEFKQLQEVLGDIHDCDVWAETIRDFLAREPVKMLEFLGHDRGMRRIAPGCENLQTRLSKKRARLHRRLSSLWNRLQREDFWGDLGTRLKGILQQSPDEAFRGGNR
jgi:CHAD domain-containing protein